MWNVPSDALCDYGMPICFAFTPLCAVENELEIVMVPKNKLKPFNTI